MKLVLHLMELKERYPKREGLKQVLVKCTKLRIHVVLERLTSTLSRWLGASGLLFEDVLEVHAHLNLFAVLRRRRVEAEALELLDLTFEVVQVPTVGGLFRQKDFI